MESNARMDSPESTESKIAAGESEPTNEGEVDSKEEMLSQNIGSNNVDEEVGQDTSRTTTTSSSIHGDKPMKTSRWSRYCRMYSLPILSLISFVLVGAAIYVAYQFIAKKNNKPIKSNSDKIKGGKIRQQQYIDNIISTIVYDKTTLLNASSSQYKAHEWMLNHDNYDWIANEQEETIRMDSHIHQRYSLAVLYFATTTPNPNVTNSLSGTNYSNWMNGQHECSRKDGGFWAGLNCNADDQVQTLWFENYAGSIPMEIGLLSMLEYLVLKRNDDSKDAGFIYGTIPTSLNQLTLLKQLDLSNNTQLSGTISSTLFSKLTNLEYLNLQNNNFFGTIPISLYKLPQLETLILGNNRLNGTIPLWNHEGTKMKYIDLHSNNFTGALPTAIGMSNSSSTSPVEYLYLNDNQLTGTIPHDFFYSNPDLRSIRFDGNAMNGTVPSSIGKMKQLQYFSA